MSKQQQQYLSKAVRNYEDMMQLRIMLGSRLVIAIKESQGIDTTQKHKKDDDEAKSITTLAEGEYHAICEEIKNLSEEAAERVYNGEVRSTDIKRALQKVIGTAKSLVKNYSIFMLLDQYVAMKRQEKRIQASLKVMLKGIPIYDQFLIDVKGCGDRISSELIAYIDISKAEYVSSLWKLAGLDVAADGKGRSKRAEHLEEKTYINAEGEEATRKGITFNPKLKRTLYYLGDQFNRHPTSKYGEIMVNYKHRISNDPRHEEKSKGHIQAMARRYAAKMFLQDLYSEWRRIEGLPVAPPYSEAKLGLNHGSAEKYA